MDNVLRIALVGAWHVHAHDYARDCEHNPNTQLVAVWDDNPERGKRAAEQWNVVFISDLDAILSDPNINGVIITTATSQHLDVMLQVIAHGKHIFTEKVLAATSTEAEAIASAAEKSGVVMTVSLPRLYTGYTRAIDEILGDGDLGDISYVRVRVAHDGGVRRNGSSQWLPEHFFDRSESMGGAMIDFGAHSYYLVHRFAGLPKSVNASYLSVSGHEVEDQALVVCNYPNSMMGVAEASFLGGVPGFQIEIHGTDGSLFYDSEDGLRTRLRNDLRWIIRTIPEDGLTPFDRWVEYIQRGETDPENVAAAFALTEMAAAAERSAAENRTVLLSTEK